MQLAQKYIAMNKQREWRAVNKHRKIITLKVANVAHHFCFIPGRAKHLYAYRMSERMNARPAKFSFNILLHVAMANAIVHSIPQY